MQSIEYQLNIVKQVLGLCYRGENWQQALLQNFLTPSVLGNLLTDLMTPELPIIELSALNSEKKDYKLLSQETETPPANKLVIRTNV